jgi:hypothetical protein
MAELSAADLPRIMGQLHVLRGRIVRFQGMDCRLVDVLDEPPMVVLKRLREDGNINTDSYGHPVALGPGFIDIPVLDPDGVLSPEFRMILLPDEAGSTALDG